MITVNPQIIARTTPLMEYLKKQRENDRLMRTLEIGGTFFFISFFALVALKPAFTTISALMGEIKSKEVLTQAMRTKINQVIDAQGSFAAIQERYGIVNSSLPDSQRYSQALIQVIGSAQDTSAYVSKVEFTPSSENQSNSFAAPSQPQLNANLKNYRFTFNTVSSFNQGLKFISDLRTNRRLYTIEDISIAPFKDAKTSIVDPSKLNFKFNMTAYYWDEPHNEAK